MPLAGGATAGAADGGATAGAAEGGAAGALVATAALVGAGRVVSTAAAAALPPPTVTSGVISSIVFAGTPALASSATVAYGRPAMIFLAVAGPTLGSASRSFWLPVLRSTG